MALTLSDGTTTLALPGNLLWADELEWDPLVQSSGYTLGGALVVEEWTRLAGRPITYQGGQSWVWVTRGELLALLALGEPVGVVLTLTHHDGRVFTVTPRREADGWLVGMAVPVVADSGAANPGAGAYYSIEALRLMEIPA